ncbi:MAG: hypothetical protein P1V20_05315 [Verrucomicrobiales bacterium]|nr:hypothetical protein [Verrucomicrobiales bacterium]
MEEWTAEEAFLEFKKRKGKLELFDVDSNEAQTRLEVIDEILFEILDWTKSEVEVEKYCRDEGFADYVFILNNNLPLVLEAKKTGVGFTIELGKIDAKKPVPFSLLASEVF